MKKSIQHIVLPIILIANLLFGQVVVNFLHSPHNEHEPDVKSQSDKSSVHRHGEHCKVCSLDIVLQLLAENISDTKNRPAAKCETTSVGSDVELRQLSNVQDRAPPAI